MRTRVDVWQVRARVDAWQVRVRVDVLADGSAAGIMVANRVLVVVRSGEMTRLFQHAIESGGRTCAPWVPRGRYASKLKVACGQGGARLRWCAGRRRHRCGVLACSVAPPRARCRLRAWAATRALPAAYTGRYARFAGCVHGPPCAPCRPTWWVPFFCTRACACEGCGIRMGAYSGSSAFGRVRRVAVVQTRRIASGLSRFRDCGRAGRWAAVDRQCCRRKTGKERTDGEYAQ